MTSLRHSLGSSIHLDPRWSGGPKLMYARPIKCTSCLPWHHRRAHTWRRYTSLKYIEWYRGEKRGGLQAIYPPVNAPWQPISRPQDVKPRAAFVRSIWCTLTSDATRCGARRAKSLARLSLFYTQVLFSHWRIAHRVGRWLSSSDTPTRDFERRW